MMAEAAVVRLLDTNTANQIAAGEVVEKPASVVKELVENALDAGATQIEVTIFAGGTEYIRVADNGCGMSEANAKLAVLRHATSKLTKAEDLLSLHTLGFRGEALPSIASVSDFTLLTRPADSDLATSVHIHGGEDTEITATGGSVGTTVIVKDLFFNVPARRKFLKTLATEGRYISELLTKLALSRPDVRFKLVSNDKELLHTAGDGSLRQAIRALYGKEVAEALLAVQLKDPELEVSGFIGKPTLLKGTRQWQTIFVNGRSIGSKLLAKAIDHAYQSQIPKSGFPFAVLNIKLPAASVDVNVHPQKSEVKFRDESQIYRTVFKALSMALTQPLSAQKAQVELLPDSELRAFVPQPGAATRTTTAAAKPAPAPAEFFPSGVGQIFKTPAATATELMTELSDRSAAFQAEDCELLAQPQSTAAEQARPAKAEQGQQTIWAPFEDFVTDKAEAYGKQATVLQVHEAREQFGGAKLQTQAAATVSEREKITFKDSDSGIASIWPIGQVDKTFIIAQSETALYLIDQHAAHERIIYDRLVAAHEQVPAQQLLLPLYIDLDPEELELLEQQQEEFLKLGITADRAGERLVRISSLPIDIKADVAENFIQSILRRLRELQQLDGSVLRQEVLHMTACKAAIKAGQLLTMKQMQQLIIDLCNTTHPFTCPHGRPSMIEITSHELYKMFKRTGF